MITLQTKAFPSPRLQSNLSKEDAFIKINTIGKNCVDLANNRYNKPQMLRFCTLVKETHSNPEEIASDSPTLMTYLSLTKDNNKDTMIYYFDQNPKFLS